MKVDTPLTNAINMMKQGEEKLDFVWMHKNDLKKSEQLSIVCTVEGKNKAPFIGPCV